jgi:glycosyltransferase involved in cell wall biosynthesis
MPLQKKGTSEVNSWCVVIPTYNNDRTLENVIRDVLRVTGDVIVVNDGSTDNTLAILLQFPAIKTVSYRQNKGKGYALKKGFEKAREEGFQYAITLDSDGQHYARDIQAFVKKIEDFPESLIVGSRTLPEDKLRKGSGFANRFSNFWFTFISGVRLPDTQSGFRLYPLEKIKNIRFFTNKYEFELEVLIRSAWRGIPLINIPIGVFYPEKNERVSHFRPFHDFVRIGLLNSVCVLIALLVVKPFSFLQYFKKENIRGFLKKNLFHTHDSMTKTILSVMFGVFMGIIPIWGYQLMTAIALAYLLRLNKFIVIMAANISIPPLIPVIIYLSYIIGGWLLSANTDFVFSSDISFAWVRDNLYQYILGSLVFAIFAAVFFGLLTYALLKMIRRKSAHIK